MNKAFRKKLNTVQPLTVTSGIIIGILVLALGYFISLRSWSIISLLIVLVVTASIPVFLKDKRKIILQRYLVIIPALLIGFILGISGLKIESKYLLPGVSGKRLVPRRKCQME